MAAAAARAREDGLACVGVTVELERRQIVRWRRLGHRPDDRVGRGAGLRAVEATCCEEPERECEQQGKDMCPAHRGKSNEQRRDLRKVTA